MEQEGWIEQAKAKNIRNRHWREEKRHTAAQQNSPQQDSPATQNVSPQHVDPVGMQKGAMFVEEGMQHWSVVFEQVNEIHPPCL